MNRRHVRWIIPVLIIAGASLLVWHYTRPEPIKVVVKPVEHGTVERTVANTRAGTVKACRRAGLSLGIGGQIATLLVREGDTVKAGQLLLELWKSIICPSPFFLPFFLRYKWRCRILVLLVDLSSER